MNRRIAKKVARLMRDRWGNEPNYRWSTLARAGHKNWQSWKRYGIGFKKLTPGGRWGRWDPSRPSDPNAIPF